jgi:hypothetical protein
MKAMVQSGRSGADILLVQNHLESVLANEPVAVKSGAQIVEVAPQVGCPHVLGYHHHRHMMGTEMVNFTTAQICRFFLVDESLCDYGPCLLSTLTLYGTLRLIYLGIWLLVHLDSNLCSGGIASNF